MVKGVKQWSCVFWSVGWTFWPNQHLHFDCFRWSKVWSSGPVCFEVLGEHSDLTSTFILIVSGGQRCEAVILCVLKCWVNILTEPAPSFWLFQVVKGVKQWSCVFWSVGWTYWPNQHLHFDCFRWSKVWSSDPVCFEVLGEHYDLTSTFILIVSGGQRCEAVILCVLKCWVNILT